jgi:hypothetical protein
MQNVPKIVSERLRASATVAVDHPDAEVLAAFSERSLPVREHAVVLEHLARCKDCRAISVLSLPAIEATQPVLRPARDSWFTWPALRWGFVAVGVLVVTSFGIFEYQQQERTRSPIATLAEPQSENFNARLDAKVQSQPVEAGPLPDGKHIEAPPSADAGTRGRQITHGPSAGKQLSTLAANTAPAGQMIADATSQAQVGQTVEVAENQPSATQESNLNVRDQQSDSVIKAKQATTAVASTTRNAAPRWAISPAGGLRRSFDLGNTWQDVDVTAKLAATELRNNPPSELDTVAGDSEKYDVADKKTSTASTVSPVFHTLAVNGSDVWVGGSNAALYHSLDGGNRWSPIVPTASGISLTGDVIILDFASAGQGRVLTSSGETWMTSDNGQTWQKR